MALNSYGAMQAQYADAYARYAQQQQAACNMQNMANMINLVSVIGHGIPRPEGVIRFGADPNPAQESLYHPTPYAMPRRKRGLLTKLVSKIF